MAAYLDVNVILLAIIAVFQISYEEEIRVGLSMPMEEVIMNVTYNNAAPAIKIAIDQAQAAGLATNFTFPIFARGKTSSGLQGTTSVLELINIDKVNVIFGPMCNPAAVIVGPALAYFDVPSFLWGPAPLSEYDNKENYPLSSTSVPNTYGRGRAILAVLEYFGWHDIAFVYTTSKSDIECVYYAQEIETAISDAHSQVTLVLKARLDEYSLNLTLSSIRQRSRIIITCFNLAADIRTFMANVYWNGMANPEYVYITSDFRKVTNDEDWNDGLGSIVRKARDYFLFISALSQVGGRFKQENRHDFDEEFLRRVQLPPFSCANCTKISPYAYFLYDAVYYYMLLLDQALHKDPQAYKSGRLIMESCGIKFPGLTGEVNMSENCTREATFYVTGYNKDDEEELYMTIKLLLPNITMDQHYSDETTSIWASRGGTRPFNEPVCGFQNNHCVSYALWYGVGGGVLALFILISLMIAAFSWRNRQLEKAELMKLWQVEFHSLSETSIKKKAESHRSLQSGLESTTSTAVDTGLQTTAYTPYLYHNEVVLAKQHQPLHRLTKHHIKLMTQMRQLDHENINKFIGLCVDGPYYLSIWKFNTRGTLRDVLQSKLTTVDAFFKFCLMRDLLHGIHAIHQNSFIGFHGSLTSSCCLVNERWQVRISDYGLIKMGFSEEKSKLDLLWTAPEILRGNEIGSKEGDVYSFAIICSEIATGQTAWNNLSDENVAEEIIYHVRRGRTPLTRPSLERNTEELTPVVLHLIRDCWAERSEDRPTTQTIKQLMRSVKLSKKQNLMDHVFALMESYAANLKQEVEEKTKEAIEEKKRADLLLYKILPPQVADKLKSGQSVEPESYDEVTIFFSDVVAFTSLAAKCTPLQVVTLLNDLYTMFDNIIDKYDVYKVEAIGDGYLCASGVPKRNGHEHGRQIANMALSIVDSIKCFRIPHLPTEKVNVRVGIHSGPCVAGVVGLAMPRYCLFGDAVNTASRMESNGKPGRIHLSSDANRLLTKVIGGFKTESRGEIMIKGKGVMETFWLLTENKKGEKEPSEKQPSFHNLAHDTSSPLARVRSPAIAQPKTLYSEYLQAS